MAGHPVCAQPTCSPIPQQAGVALQAAQPDRPNMRSEHSMHTLTEEQHTHLDPGMEVSNLSSYSSCCPGQ